MKAQVNGEIRNNDDQKQYFEFYIEHVNNVKP